MAENYSFDPKNDMLMKKGKKGIKIVRVWVKPSEIRALETLLTTNTGRLGYLDKNFAIIEIKEYERMKTILLKLYRRIKGVM